MEKKLSIKVQSNLARFKIDLQNLRKAVETLKTEQDALQTKPIQQILSAMNVFFQLTVVVLSISLIDLLTSDWIAEAHQGLDNEQSLVKIGIRSMLRVDLELCNLSAKLGLHDNIQVVLLVCILIVPLLLYVIKVYSPTIFSP